MSVHLLKLSVGPESLTALARRQQRQLAEARRPPELLHVTRTMPRRAVEVLDGGSIYWVIKGWIVARQELRELRPIVKDGVPHCGLVLAPEMMSVHPRACRPFQGWRYLEAADAPKDLGLWSESHQMPDELQRELIALGLI